MPRPPVAVVHDYLTQRGGAERVVRVLLDAFPDAPLYTSLYEPDATYPEFRDRDVRTLWPNAIAAVRRDHRRGLPLFAPAFLGQRVDADVVVCSSSGWAHLVRATGPKLVYCYTPARWLYDERAAYLRGFPTAVSAGLRAIGPALRLIDRRGARTAATYLAISTVVRQRVASAYGIEADVVPPPVAIDPEGPRTPVEGIDPGFVLCVSRLLAYKRVREVVRAFAQTPDLRLVVVGSGPDRDEVAGMAPPNVVILDQVSDEQLRWLYGQALGLVAAAAEDFGLTPLEAASFGKPAAVLRAGGYLDTVVEGATGLFFEDAEPGAIARAIVSMTERSWDSDAIRAHATGFGEGRFVGELRRRVAALAR